ncbi:MAG: SOS response-associated peptidase [Planctomycetota bacterium]|nr:SOS response-associated peptidase [Planctomycetota bacterium]
MCGRFTLRTSVPEIAKEFGLAGVPDLSPRYNIAPTQPVAAVRLDASRQRRCVDLHWGLIPAWAEDPAIGNRLINARGETVSSKPAFRQAFQRRRCLVVADGFFEWQNVGGGKRPHYIRLKEDRPFGFAGLWERWQRGDQTIESCTIITTEPNALMQPIHDRMPVILDPAAYDLWLDPEVRSGQKLEDLLRPYPADRLEAFPVGTVVNNPRNDVAECILRLHA